jgi:protein O-mannosyl-transferase
MGVWTVRRPLSSFGILSVAWILLLYCEVFSSPFIYDDLDQISQNGLLTSWGAVWEHYLTKPSHLGAGLWNNAGGVTYRPVFWILLALEQHILGANPVGYHLVSLVLHWANGTLLFMLLCKLRMHWPAAAIAALVWLGMPINSEAVAWISGQLYPLSTGFLLLALLFALEYVRNAGSHRLIMFTSAALSAIFSHEQGILLLGFLILGFALLEDSTGPRRWAALFGIALLVDLAYVLIRWRLCAWSRGGLHTFAAAGEVFWYYIQLIVLPVRMSVERSTDVPSDRFTFEAIIAWLGLLTLLASLIKVYRLSRAQAGAVGVLLIAILPYCGFVFIYQGMAERYAYIASIGLAVCFTLAVFSLKSVSPRGVFLLLAIWVAWGGWRLMRRVRDWKNPVAFYCHSAEVTPRSVLLHLNCGVALQTIGNQDEAEAQYRRVISLAPDNSDAYVDLEGLYIQEQRFGDAISVYKQVISMSPASPTAYFDMGVMFQQLGKYHEAAAFYKKVLELQPNDPQTMLYLSHLANNK